MSGDAHVIGAFDNVRASDVRFLQEAAGHGNLRVHLLDDEAAAEVNGSPPKFPFAERRYLLDALRFVTSVHPVPMRVAESLCDRPIGGRWVFLDGATPDRFRRRAEERGGDCVVIRREELAGYPDLSNGTGEGKAKRVIVTGCYDWFHSGHVRFFEEVAALGDLYVVVGHDANIRLLKGAGHPMFPDVERRYLAACVTHVREALISSGNGWLDAEPEIERIRPHIYAVNEDGDRPEKRRYCEGHGIEYLVLRRVPAPGLPTRSSTDLRGF